MTGESTPSPDPTATNATGTQSPKSIDDSSAQPKQPKADPGPGEQFEVRVGKRKRLCNEGWDPYPVSVPVTTTTAAMREDYAHLEVGQETNDVAGMVSRVAFLRNTDRLYFVTLQDGAGTTLQAMLSAKTLPVEGHTVLVALKAGVDPDDHLFIRGHVISLRCGELSVMAEPVLCKGTEAASAGDDGVEVPVWRIVSEALHSLPKTWIDEVGEAVTLSEEQRVYRHELDLLIRPATRNMACTRAAIVRSVRKNFFRHDYLELETSVLQATHSRVVVRPSITHMNALDMDLCLRIATKIYLKRAVISGVDRVFKINHNFRNEGVGSSHFPKFTVLEAYEAYSDYDGVAELIRNLVQQAARDAFDLPESEGVVTLVDGTEYDLLGEWDKINLYTSVSEALGEETTVEAPREQLVVYTEKISLEADDYAVAGKVVKNIFEEFVGNKLWAPTFVYGFPGSTSPLTRYYRNKPGLTERWDPCVCGFETATAYSGLADPVVQRERFGARTLTAVKGDPEAMILDEDFLVAMGQGFPPSGGMGMGIGRLLVVLIGQDIHETITFPLAKRGRPKWLVPTTGWSLLSPSG